MKRPMLLCLNLSPDSLRKIRLTAMRFKVLLRPVAPQEYGQTLGALCGLEPLREGLAAGEAFSDPVLVMAHFPPPLFNPFLKALRAAGIPESVLKAMLTPTNSEWDCIKLHSELCLERQALESGENAVHQPKGAQE